MSNTVVFIEEQPHSSVIDIKIKIYLILLLLLVHGESYLAVRLDPFCWPFPHVIMLYMAYNIFKESFGRALSLRD